MEVPDLFVIFELLVNLLFYIPTAYEVILMRTRGIYVAIMCLFFSVGAYPQAQVLYCNTAQNTSCEQANAGGQWTLYNPYTYRIVVHLTRFVNNGLKQIHILKTKPSMERRLNFYFVKTANRQSTIR
ncbi:hypothetical protein HDF14_003056 [Edaphobacter lichenicola]|uniref:Uncharacterized protein n=1 Tax=Tunturiibacter gelidiferens TaxID=3069689 RepID=A0A9X0U4L0_9BACT|nr:hypothetical protein [Edaphobacter lichenicola]